MKLNCWEAKGCGRHPGGEKTEELGVCPASTEQRTHGVNNGTNGGRACWAIKETLCGNQVQGGFAEKFADCLQCNFYSKVRDEEASNFMISKEILVNVGTTRTLHGASPMTRSVTLPIITLVIPVLPRLPIIIISTLFFAASSTMYL